MRRVIRSRNQQPKAKSLQAPQAPAELEFMLLYVIRSYLALSTQNSQIKNMAT